MSILYTGFSDRSGEWMAERCNVEVDCVNRDDSLIWISNEDAVLIARAEFENGQLRGLLLRFVAYFDDISKREAYSPLVDEAKHILESHNG